MIYVLFPGEVMSRTDGQEHYITAPQLARLYGVDYKKCKVVYLDKPSSVMGYQKQPYYVELYPRYDGNYQNKTGEVEK